MNSYYRFKLDELGWLRLQDKRRFVDYLTDAQAQEVIFRYDAFCIPKRKRLRSNWL